jgi:hypothetical protein
MKTQINVKMYLAITMLTILISCSGIAQESKTPTRTKTFELSEPGTLNAKSSGGKVVVKTHNKSEVIIEMYIRKNGKILDASDPKVEDVLDNFDLELEKNGTEITANANRKGNFSWNEGIAFTIIVPEEMSCNVSSSGGSVKVSGVSGTHDIKSSGGSVKLENTSGDTKAKSSGGSAKATNHNGDIHLTSCGGGIYIDNANGSVFAKSSGGSVKLNNIHGGVDASSSGGGVHVNGECAYIKAKSSGGSVKVNISNVSKEVHLRSSGGGVTAVIHDGDKLGLDLDLSSPKVNVDLHNFSGEAKKDYVNGTMNNGGIPVYMHASGGNVNLSFND